MKLLLFLLVAFLLAIAVAPAAIYTSSKVREEIALAEAAPVKSTTELWKVGLLGLAIAGFVIRKRL